MSTFFKATATTAAPFKDRQQATATLTLAVVTFQFTEATPIARG